MCGIAGFWAVDRDVPHDAGMALNQQMTDRITHRGPDAAGHWADAESGIFLGHRRLSIIDLSDAGAQPIHSHDGRWVMVFNGEIYNYKEIIPHLERANPAISFKGHSDSEVLLEAFSLLGVEETLALIKGMFAIALWDKRERILRLVRDHVGKKPLYVGRIAGKIAFASELKALRPLFGNAPAVNQEAMVHYNYFGFIPAPHSIYQGVYKVEAAHVVTLCMDEIADKGDDFILSSMHRYWRVEKASEPAGAFRDILNRSVSNRMISDVPLGSFLSGGIDSSLITALMQEQSSKPVKSYSIGFSDHAFDESKHAEKVAAHLGTDHTTYRVNETETQSIIEHLPQMYDEPFADYSQIPTAILCQQAKKDTTVVLSGDGGDEVFCGYKRYFMLKKLLDATRFMPRKAISGMLKMLSQNGYNKIGFDGKRMHSIAEFLQEDDLDGAILRSLSINPSQPRPHIDFGLSDDLGDLERMMMIDTHFYMPDDILVKVDRASMFSSLEVRSPLLDKDLIEYAWTMPIADKIFAGHGRGKRPLYDLLCEYVPEDLVNRPKQGFTPPIAAWLKGDLRDWAQGLIEADTGLYDPAEIADMWDDFTSGRADNHSSIWGLLMAQSWCLNNDSGFSNT